VVGVPSTAIIAAMKLISEPSCSAEVSIPISYEGLDQFRRERRGERKTYTLIKESLDDFLLRRKDESRLTSEDGRSRTGSICSASSIAYTRGPTTSSANLRTINPNHQIHSQPNLLRDSPLSRSISSSSVKEENHRDVDDVDAGTGELARRVVRAMAGRATAARAAVKARVALRD
jgi:hypothetical protein